MDASSTAASGNSTTADNGTTIPTYVFLGEDLGHGDRRKSILVSVWILTALSFMFLSARLICKRRARRGFWWDDYVMTMAWMVVTVSVGLAHWSVTKGEGLHIWDVPEENYALLGLLGNLTSTFSILGVVWSKTSFALTLLRLMSSTRMQVLLWLAIATINIAMDLNAVFLWLRCTPLAKTWNPAIPGTCWAPQVYPIFGIFAAGYSGLMDFVLALLPWKIVWRLQMKKQEKLGVAIAMSLGGVAGGIAIVKTSQIAYLASGDFTYDSTPLIVWGVAEASVTIMAASIPVLRVLLRDASSLTLSRYRASTALSYFGNTHHTHTEMTADGTHNSIIITRSYMVEEENLAGDEQALRHAHSKQSEESAEISAKEPDTFNTPIGCCKGS